MKKYVLLTIGKREFKTGKIILVGVEAEYTYLSEYMEDAKMKVCKEFNYNPDDVSVLDWKFLGDEVIFIN